MGASKTTYGLIFYFMGILIAVSLISASGALDSSQYIVDQRFSSSMSSKLNNSAAVADAAGSYSIKDTFADLFSFFFWNISIYEGETLVQYLWVFRIIFVYIPLLILFLNIYYSLPTVSG